MMNDTLLSNLAKQFETNRVSSGVIHLKSSLIRILGGRISS